MDAAAAFFLSGFIFFIAGTFLFLKRDSVGIKSVIAIANSKNSDIQEIRNDLKQAYVLIAQWNNAQKDLAIKSEIRDKELWEHTEKMTRSTRMEFDLLKQEKKKENIAIDLFFYDGVNKTLATKSKNRPLEATQ